MTSITLNQAGWFCGNTPGLYLGGATSGSQLSWWMLLVIFLNPYRQILGQYLRLCHKRFLPNTVLYNSAAHNSLDTNWVVRSPTPKSYDTNKAK
jgi:hypothetical protein